MTNKNKRKGEGWRAVALGMMVLGSGMVFGSAMEQMSAAPWLFWAGCWWVGISFMFALAHFREMNRRLIREALRSLKEDP